MKSDHSRLSTPFVANFCFPMGVKVEAVQRTQSASGKMELLFGQLSRVEQTECTHVFLITGEQHLLYGVCVSQVELLEVLGLTICILYNNHVPNII